MNEHFTGRERYYVGSKCQWVDPDPHVSNSRPCWHPVTHRVQRGPYSWWFVCFEHIEGVCVAWHGPQDDGKPKSRVKTLCTEPAAAATAQLFYTLGYYSRTAKRLRARNFTV